MGTDQPMVWAGRCAAGTLLHGVVETDAHFAGGVTRRPLCDTLSPSGRLSKLDRAFSPLESGVCTECARLWSATQDSPVPGWEQQCAECEAVLPINQFAADARTSSGFARRCLRCVERIRRERRAATERGKQSAWEAERFVKRIDLAHRQVERINAWQPDPLYPTLACRFDNTHPPVVASVDVERADVRLTCPECGWSEPVSNGLSQILHVYRHATPETLAMLKPFPVQ